MPTGHFSASPGSEGDSRLFARRAHESSDPQEPRVPVSNPPAQPHQRPAMPDHSKTRTEKDTMGPMDVPADALYGASTQRAVLNFPMSGRPVPEAIIRAYAVLKAACAAVNLSVKRLDAARAKAIIEACRE